MSSCFAYGCNHRAVHDTCKFFRFPKDSSELEVWKEKCRRRETEIKYFHRLCSCHFVDGVKSNGPSLFGDLHVSSSGKSSAAMQSIEDLDIKEALSQRGNILLIHENFKFHQFKRMLKGELKWRCHNRKCAAFLLTLGESGSRLIVERDLKHNHSAFNERNVRRAALSAAAKRKFSDNFESATEEIVDKCLMQFSDLKQEDLECIKKALNYLKKRKTEGEAASTSSNQSAGPVDPFKTEEEAASTSSNRSPRPVCPVIKIKKEAASTSSNQSPRPVCPVIKIKEEAASTSSNQSPRPVCPVIKIKEEAASTSSNQSPRPVCPVIKIKEEAPSASSNQSPRPVCPVIKIEEEATSTSNQCGVPEISHSLGDLLDISKIKTEPESDPLSSTPMFNSLAEPDSSAPLKFRDEFDVSGWVYGNTLRTLDPNQRLIFEKLVSDLTFKAKLNQLTLDSKVVHTKDNENLVSSTR